MFSPQRFCLRVDSVNTSAPKLERDMCSDAVQVGKDFCEVFFSLALKWKPETHVTPSLHLSSFPAEYAESFLKPN